MDCQEIFEALSDFIDRDLSDKACGEIEKHLEDCINCRIVVNTLHMTVSLYHSMPRQEMPGEVRMRLHRMIEIEDTGKGSS